MCKYLILSSAFMNSPFRSLVFFTFIVLFSTQTSAKEIMASLIVGTYTEKMAHVPNANGEGIYIYEISSNSSISFRKNQTITNITNPTFLETTKSGKFLYAATESLSLDKSLIHAYDISNGYRYIDSWPIGGIGACHVRIDDGDRFVFVSDYNGGNIASFKIDSSTGRLEKRNFYQFTEFSNVNPDRQEAPHLHSSILDKASRFVYFADLGNDCIWRMNFSNETGFDSNIKQKYAAPPGSGPRHLAFNPIDQRFLYVSCELTNHLLVYKVEEDGSLKQVQYVPTTQNSSFAGPKGAADIHVSPDGRFVYVTTRFLDTISVFQIHQQQDGKVALIQEIGSGGEIPRNFIIYPRMGLVFVANQNTNDVTVFRRDVESGQLTEIEKAQVNTPVCLKIID